MKEIHAYINQMPKVDNNKKIHNEPRERKNSLNNSN